MTEKGGGQGSFSGCLTMVAHSLRTTTGSCFVVGIISAVETLKTPKCLGNWCAQMRADEA